MACDPTSPTLRFSTVQVIFLFPTRPLPWAMQPPPGKTRTKPEISSPSQSYSASCLSVPVPLGLSVSGAGEGACAPRRRHHRFRGAFRGPPQEPRAASVTRRCLCVRTLLSILGRLPPLFWPRCRRLSREHAGPSSPAPRGLRPRSHGRGVTTWASPAGRLCSPTLVMAGPGFHTSSI